MNAIAHHWPEVSEDPLTVEAIRKLHVPSSHYRISASRYKAGAALPGAGKSGRIYVLAGACVKTIGTWRVELRAGMFADFPAGAFEFEVLGDEDVQVVNVWWIPEQFRTKGDA